MLYSIYELNHFAVAPFRAAAMAGASFIRSPLNPVAETPAGRTAVAAAEVFESVTRRYRKPDWNLPTTPVNGVDVPVQPCAVWSNAWCNLIHFRRDPAALRAARTKRGDPGDREDPRVLIVAPLSGHYATLLRGTVEAFLPEHEVFITDWADARMVPILAGRFDLNDYIDHVVHMIRRVGPAAHLVAVCQPGPPVLAAIALMAEGEDPALPATMTYMGSPIDARKSPTVTNKLAEERPFEWFVQNMIHTVPPMYPGAFRQVYPGFIQLASFLGMNWDRHVDAHRRYFEHLTQNNEESAEKHREFYEEYLSVLDLTEEFYLQTISDVFQEYKLARGAFDHRGHRVKPEAIRNVALMTVEGENDDISGIGQTQAAHDLCYNIPEAMRIDHVQPAVGHYGVFSGRRFRTEIQPRIAEFMRQFGRVAPMRRIPRRQAEAA